MNALAFTGTDFIFNRITDHGVKERKRHDLAEEKLQRRRNNGNEERMKRIDFINKRLREKNETKAYTNNVDKAILE